MAAVAVVPVELAVEMVVTTAVETAVEAAVETAVETAVESAVENAVETAVEKAVVGAVESTVESTVAATISNAISAAVMTEKMVQTLGQAAANAISSKVKVLVSQAELAIMNALQSNLQPIIDDASLPAMQKLVRLKQRIASGEPGPTWGPTECCNLITEMQAAGEAFSLFTVATGAIDNFVDMVIVKHSELAKLRADPYTAPVVNSIIAEFTKQPVPASTTTPAAGEPTADANHRVLVGVPKKWVDFYPSCEVVPFINQQLYNVDGSTIDKRMNPWVRWWEWCVDQAGKSCLIKCYIADNLPHTDPEKGNIVGGHMELKALDGWWYMLPICKRHNNKQFDRTLKDGTAGTMMTSVATAWAIKFPIHDDYVPPAVAHLVVPTVADTPAALKLLVTHGGNIAKTVMPTAVSNLMAAVKAAVEAAGADAKSYTSSEGKRITLLSLIPFYGWVEGPIELSHMKENCLNYFNNAVQNRVTAAVNAFSLDNAAVTAAITAYLQSPAWKQALSTLIPQ